MNSSIGRRVSNNWRLIETKETGETMGTNGDALQCKKGSRRQLETKETGEALETNGDTLQ